MVKFISSLKNFAIPTILPCPSNKDMYTLIFNNINEDKPEPKNGLEAAFNCYIFITALLSQYEENEFSFPSNISLVIKNEYSLNEKDTANLSITMDHKELGLTLRNLQIILIGYCFQQASNALEIKYNGNPKKSPSGDTDIDSLRAVCFSVRNASAHGAGIGTWCFNGEDNIKFYEKKWSIKFDIDDGGIKKNQCVEVDLSNKNGQIVCNEDFGGTKNMILLLQFARQILK